MTTVGVAAPIRDDGRYLPEWLDWHRKMGVTRFYLWDQDSYDNTADVVEGADDITLRQLPDKGTTYMYGLLLYEQAYIQKQVDWVAFIDPDEFIWHPSGRTLPEILDDYPDELALLCECRYFWWGNTYLRPSNQLGQYVYRLPDGHEWNHAGSKTIVRTGYSVLVRNYHFVIPDQKPIYEQSGLLVNHYFTRSLQECVERRRLRVTPLGRQYDTAGVGHVTWEEILRRTPEATTFDDRLATLSQGMR